MSSNLKMFEVLYGPVDEPLDDWQVNSTHMFDPDKETSPSRWGDNIGPEMIQELYVRQPNWELTYSAKLQKIEVTHRYMMRQVPSEQDYRKRARDNNWVMWDRFYSPHDFQLPRLAEDRRTVTYYETEKDARLDRPKTVPALRYLRLRGYDEYDVASIARQYSIPYADEFELKFATTREEVQWVYVNGPRSCMSGDCEVRDYGFHSAEVYACDPIAVAYLIGKDDPEHIAARALVNTKTKKYVTIYGARPQMHEILVNQGYHQDYDALKGEKLLRLSFIPIWNDVPQEPTYPMPYNDYSGRTRASDCGQFWVVE